MKSQFTLLSSQRFLPLFMTQFLGAFNDNVFKNAMVILMTYTLAEKSGLDTRILVTAAAGVFILPFFLFSATAGQLADKFEKSSLIRTIKLAEIILMMLGAGAFYFGSVWMLMIVLFLMGAQSSFFGPLKYSILPDHLKEGELIGANALVEAGTFLAILLGTILGGVMILKDAGVIFISLIVISTAIFGWVASCKIPKAPAAAPKLKINYNFLGEAWNIICHTRKNEDVFLSILGISWFWLVGFTFLAQFPVYGKDVIGGNEDVVTLFLTVFSVGIVLGSLVCNKLLKGKVSGSLAHIGALGMSAFIVLLYIASPGGVAEAGDYMGIREFIFIDAENLLILFSLLMVSVFGGIYIVPLYAIMQSRSEDSHRSRTVAANNILNSLFMVGGALATMTMLKMNMRVVDVFLTLAILNIPVAFLVHRIVRKQQAKRKGK